MSLQRSEIVTLKAVGYQDRQIVLHYLKLVTVMLLMAATVGELAGPWFGRWLVVLLGKYLIELPLLAYKFEARHAIHAVLIGMFAAVLGALATAWHVMRLPPPRSCDLQHYRAIVPHCWNGWALRSVRAGAPHDRA